MTQGPNVKKLIIEKMSLLMVPPGAGDGKPHGAMLHGMAEISKPGNLVARYREATEWVEAAIKAVRMAPGENPWAGKTDDVIADEIMKKIEERRSSR